jgi:phosphoglucosamine mutase
MVRAGTSAAALGALMDRTPQHLLNVRLERRDPRVLERLRPLVDAARERLADSGRVLVRDSGTEPLVRVMVEADDDDLARREARALADAAAGIARDLGTVP